MDSTARKFAWPAGVLLAVLYFGPSILRFFIPQQHPQVQRAQKPAAGIPIYKHPVISAQSASLPNTATPVTDTPSPLIGDMVVPKFLGTWSGMLLTVPGRGRCSLQLQIKNEGDHDHPFTGYSTLSCVPSMFDYMKKTEGKKQTPSAVMAAMSRQVNPTGAILSGAMDGDSLKLIATKNIGVAEVEDGCPMSSITVTQFSEQLAIDWKESQQGICQGGQMLVTKVVR